MRYLAKNVFIAIFVMAVVVWGMYTVYIGLILGREVGAPRLIEHSIVWLGENWLEAFNILMLLSASFSSSFFFYIGLKKTKNIWIKVVSFPFYLAFIYFIYLVFK